MKTHASVFDEHEVLHHLQHYLPAQAPLKDFVHHNTLHAFQDKPFHEALQHASQLFGYKTYLSLAEFRARYRNNEINIHVLHGILEKRKGIGNSDIWLKKLLDESYDESIHPRIGKLRAIWKDNYSIDLDKSVQATLFRVLCSYLDQGISIWNFPAHENGFLASIRELEKNSFSSFFKTERARNMLLKGHLKIENLLQILVGDEMYFEEYLFDQQFGHPGWSGMVSAIENDPKSLLDAKTICLKDVILFELLLEIDVLDNKFGTNWSPLANQIKEKPVKLFSKVTATELSEVLQLWQEAFEWSLYDQVLAGVQLQDRTIIKQMNKSFQAMFCIDDRECSIRRYVEKEDANAETFGTAGFFGVEFFYQPIDGKSYTKLCPAPVTPKYLIKEVGEGKKRDKEPHMSKHSHTMVPGWIISQTLGFWAAFKLFLNIFRPTMTPATSASFRHLDKNADLTIENKNPNDIENGLQVGFTIEEMANRVEALLKSIGLVNEFAPLVYAVGHGATSVNNTHYAGYDCGACSGRPGSVNAKVISFMANHPKVREILSERGIQIPVKTQFLGGIHDTTRDEIVFYDEHLLSPEHLEKHKANLKVFNTALDFNAKERSRRFDTVNTKSNLKNVHESIKRRSVSLFEPRPELNHATNALCVVGRRTLSKGLFLDRRSFMNSFDYKVDPEGNYLTGILKAVAPVCGGINLEYYFSRVDNHRLGAGTKLPHNVMGLIGVSNGVEGDLRPGLPSQMIEVHDPVRLMVVVEHYPEIVQKAMKALPETYEWFKNEWVHITAVHPETRELFYFKDEEFVPYVPVQRDVQKVNDVLALAEKHQDNLPVYLLN
jgi:uncharacterized protein